MPRASNSFFLTSWPTFTTDSCQDVDRGKTSTPSVTFFGRDQFALFLL